MADFVERFRLKSSYRICILVSETGSRACWRQSISVSMAGILSSASCFNGSNSLPASLFLAKPA